LICLAGPRGDLLGVLSLHERRPTAPAGPPTSWLKPGSMLPTTPVPMAPGGTCRGHLAGQDIVGSGQDSARYRSAAGFCR